jgi:hypothetical protein
MAAKEGKHPGGRPRKFSSVEQMQTRIDDYFATTEEPWTVLGLALHLDLTREGLSEYQDRPEFSAPIQRAKTLVEQSTARRMMQGKGWGPGHIFVLKNNFGWKDQQQIEHSGAVHVHFDKRYEDV